MALKNKIDLASLASLAKVGKEKVDQVSKVLQSASDALENMSSTNSTDNLVSSISGKVKSLIDNAPQLKELLSSDVSKISEPKINSLVNATLPITIEKDTEEMTQEMVVEGEELTVEEREVADGLWDKVLVKAMAIPMVAVNREDFLNRELRVYIKDQNVLKQVVEGDPTQFLTKPTIDAIAEACIKNELLKVTSISTLAGIPGGVAMLATIPTDLAQYYGHALIVSQKLAYLYGYPNLLDGTEVLNTEMSQVLTVFVGTMMGVQSAQNLIAKGSLVMAQQMAKRIAAQALTKTAYYPVIKKIAQYMGIKMTKEIFAKSVSKVVPLLGGALSGGLTYVTFKNMTKRLVATLDKQYAWARGEFLLENAPIQPATLPQQ